MNSTYISLDGAVENPHLWPSLPLGSAAERMDVQSRLLYACDIRLMRERGLLDMLTLWVYPQFVRGTADDLMFDPDVAATFALKVSQTLSNGIVVLDYTVHSTDIA